MRVLVTGGSGFTGRFVLQELAGRGHEVHAVARSEAAADRVRSGGATVVWGDLDDPASIDAAFSSEEFDCLLNVASLGFGHGPTVVAAAENAGIERAVFVSTTAVETSIAAASKAVRLAAEDAIRSSALRWTIIRPTMIYGRPGDRNMSRLLSLVRRTPVVPIPGDGAGLQQPVHVIDLAATIVRAAERDAAIGKIYDVAGPEPLSFREVLDATFAAVGRKPRYVRIPVRPARAALAAAERVLPNPGLKVEQLDRLGEDKAFDIGEARRDLDHSPRPFEIGIKELAAQL